MGFAEHLTWFTGKDAVKKTSEQQVAHDVVFEVVPVTLDDVKKRGVWKNKNGKRLRVDPIKMTTFDYTASDPSTAVEYFGDLEALRKSLEWGQYVLFLSPAEPKQSEVESGVSAEASNDTIVAASQKGARTKDADLGEARGGKEKEKKLERGGRGGNGKGPGGGDDDELNNLIAGASVSTSATDSKKTKTLSDVAPVQGIPPLAEPENAPPAADVAVSVLPEVGDAVTGNTSVSTETESSVQEEVVMNTAWRKELDEFLARREGVEVVKKLKDMIVEEWHIFEQEMHKGAKESGTFVSAAMKKDLWGKYFLPQLKEMVMGYLEQHAVSRREGGRIFKAMVVELEEAAEKNT